jgi:hypothetical protein
MLICTASLASDDHCSEVAMMSSCRVQRCDKFEQKRGLRGGAVVDDCNFGRVDSAKAKAKQETENAFRVSARSLGKNYSSASWAQFTRELAAPLDFFSILEYAVYVMCHDIILASSFAFSMFCSRFLT